MIVVGITSLVGCLVLAIIGLRSHQLNFQRTAMMALAWLGIILGLVLAIRWFGA